MVTSHSHSESLGFILGLIFVLVGIGFRIVKGGVFVLLGIIFVLVGIVAHSLVLALTLGLIPFQLVLDESDIVAQLSRQKSKIFIMN